MKTKKRDPLRTEAAIERAVQELVEDRAYACRVPGEPYHMKIQMYREYGDRVLAIADLRDLYRKRAPIKMKDLRKAIQPRRKR